MTDLNNVVLIGRVTKDVGSDERSFSVTDKGARANVSIAVNRSVKKGEEWTDEASFFDVVLWGKLAENLKPYLTKGQQIVVSGYLKQDRWEKEGQKNSKVYIVADSVQLTGGRKDNGESSSATFTKKSDAVPQADSSFIANETIPF